ncbi:universal stress protein [Phytohabitans aurantiacus]|jgi:nucleotide-binding universal stress UspA family protein|uniref:Universal stress protein n=1 Tax=Phytohabitans aurantiacus TaxID=3016789 RepID=A0ABQ5QZ07_9ACTN|nr:universal stress protein [Phytohabitans aurantiacus]GLH99788.1 universal stress protein [Phytohabitans aurantiacus]
MTTNYQIVVGVDGSDGGRRALRWAVREAAGHGGTVQAVTAWRWDGIDAMPPGTLSPADERERAETMLRHEIEMVPPHERGALPIATEVLEGRPGDVLAAAARRADLLVLGSHGHSRVRHTVLGSVSEECIRKSSCPVVVVPVPHPVPSPATPAVP